MVEAAPNKDTLRNEARALVVEASHILQSLNYDPVKPEEIEYYAKSIFGYLRQRVHKKRNLPPLDALTVAAGILELRGTRGWIMRIMIEPFANILRRAQEKAHEYKEKIVGLEYTTPDQKYELVHLYYADSLLRAGKEMRNCLRYADSRGERLEEDEHGARYSNVYGLRPRNLTQAIHEPSRYRSLLEVHVESEIMTELEGAGQIPLPQGNEDSHAMLKAIVHLKSVYSNLYIPPFRFREWGLMKGSTLLCDGGYTVAYHNTFDATSENVISGRVVGNSCSIEELQRAARLPVLLEMSGASQSAKNSLRMVRGAIRDNARDAHYQNLAHVALLVVPGVDDIVAAAPMLRSGLVETEDAR